MEDMGQRKQVLGMRQRLTVVTKEEEGVERTVIKLESLEKEESFILSVPTKRMVEKEIGGLRGTSVKTENIAVERTAKVESVEVDGFDDDSGLREGELGVDESLKWEDGERVYAGKEAKYQLEDQEALQLLREQWKEECQKMQEQADEDAKYLKRHSVQFTMEFNRLILLWNQHESTRESKELFSTLWRYGALREFGEMTKFGQQSACGKMRFRKLLRLMLRESSRERMVRVQVRARPEEAEKEFGVEVMKSVRDWKPSGTGGVWGFLGELDCFAFME